MSLSRALLFSLICVCACGDVDKPGDQGLVDPNPTPNSPNNPNNPNPNNPGATALPAAALEGDRRRRAEALTSLFENGTIELQYDYIEDLGDGRGYTAGRAGFTSATGDLRDVVRTYTDAVPNNRLADYLPRLEELANDGSGDTSGLDGFPEAWVDSAKDPEQHSAQDAIVDREYFNPAMKLVDDNGLITPLSRAIFYDTLIQHGGGDDPDGLPALVTRTKAAVKTTPKAGEGERDWITAFLAERRKTLEHAENEATREVWAESVGRVDVLKKLVEDNKWGLDTSLTINTAGYNVTIP